MRGKNGKEYMSLRDACTMSGYTESRMKGLCLEGKVACLSVDETYLIEKDSLLEHVARIKSGEERKEVAMSDSVEIWEKRMLNKVGVIVGVVALFFLVVIVPTFLMSTDQVSEMDLSYAPSTYNSMSGIISDNGALASSIVSLNESIAEGIADAVASTVVFLREVF